MSAKRKHTKKQGKRTGFANRKYSSICKRVSTAIDNKPIPLSTRRVIDSVNKYLDKPFILKSLNRLTSKTSNQQARVRDRIRKVIITLLSHMTWSNRNIGIAKSDVFDTVCHDVFIDLFKKIHGTQIAKRTWERDISRLKAAGYIDTKPIVSTKEMSLRGETCPKWFTDKMFFELGFKVEDLSDWAERSIKKLIKDGLTNQWPVYAPQTFIPRQSAFDFPPPTYDEVPATYDDGFGWEFDTGDPLIT